MNDDINDVVRTSSNPLLWDRAIRLVSGYPEHSYPPKTAYRAGLRYRFAIVMFSDCKNDPEPSFDAEFFLSLTRAVQNALDFDTQLIELEDSLTVGSLDELAELYRRVGAAECEAPKKISYYKNSRLICEEETEFWNEVGGPFLYHDSRTFSFYNEEDRFEEFVLLCAAVCEQFGVYPPMRYWGQDFKKPYPWYKWLLPSFVE